MSESKNSNDTNQILNQILDKLTSLESEIHELKEEKEKFLWKQSIESSLKKTWDNELDEEWSKLL